MMAFINWTIDPLIFPPFELLRWYGLCWTIGVLVAYQFMTVAFKRESISLRTLDGLAFYVLIGAILGARLGHILFYDPQYYWQNPLEVLPIVIEPEFEFVGFAGLASHGGVLGSLLALWFVQRKYKLKFIWMLDRLVIAGALLGGFIRLGNLLNSEIIGIPTQVPWAFIFSIVDASPRHPAQLYEALGYFLIATVLYRIWLRPQTNWSGFLFGVGVAAIFSMRFLLEFLKENQVGFEDGLLLNMGQLLSIPLIITGLLFVFLSNRSNMNEPTGHGNF